MARGDGVRRSIRTIYPEEGHRLTQALLALQRRALPPEERRGIEFLPWHRELCNHFESLLREIDPELSLHYWDWNQDTRDLFTPSFNLPFAEFGLPFDAGSAKAVARSSAVPDDEILAVPSFSQLTRLLEHKHSAARFIYFGGTFIDAQVSLHDPFALLVHSNLDRLFAMWQTRADEAWRLDPAQVYGDAYAALSRLSFDPARGEAARPRDGSHTRRIRTYVHAAVVAPPRYDTVAFSGPQRQSRTRLGYDVDLQMRSDPERPGY